MRFSAAFRSRRVTVIFPFLMLPCIEFRERRGIYSGEAVVGSNNPSILAVSEMRGHSRLEILAPKATGCK